MLSEHGKLNLGYEKNKGSQSNNASAGMCNDYPKHFSILSNTEFVKRITKVIVFGMEERREGKYRLRVCKKNPRACFHIKRLRWKLCPKLYL